jgi:PAS domain S-box-containing protein
VAGAGHAASGDGVGWRIVGAPFEFGSTGAAAQSQLAAIVQSSHDAIMGKTLDGRITSWNPGAERLYGYTAQEMVGRRVDALFLPAWVATEASVLSRIAGGERVEQFQIERRHKDGGTIMVSLSLSPIADDTGAVVGVASVSRDVSERQAARERLKSQAERDRMEARLHQSQRLESLGQLAGGVAHDFNNLLAVMLNYTTFVAEQITARAEADPDGHWHDVRNDITQIQRAGERATELTHQLLAFGRREVVRPQILNLNTVLGEIEPFLRRTLGEHIQLRPQMAADLWPVLADPGQLEQVLVNLAVNARDAMPKGGTLSIGTANRILDEAAAETRTGLRPGRHVELWIADTGTGIPPAIAERVFEPFFTTKPKWAPASAWPP